MKSKRDIKKYEEKNKAKKNVGMKEEENKEHRINRLGG